MDQAAETKIERRRSHSAAAL